MNIVSFYRDNSSWFNLAAVEISVGHEKILDTDKGLQTALVSFGMHLGRSLGRIGVLATRCFNLLNPWSKNPSYKKIGLLASSTTRLVISPLQIGGSVLFALINGAGNVTRSEKLKTFSQKGLQRLAGIDTHFDSIEALFFDADCPFAEVEAARQRGEQAIR